MSLDEPLREGQVLTGPLFNEPMRVVTARPGGGGAWPGWSARSPSASVASRSPPPISRRSRSSTPARPSAATAGCCSYVREEQGPGSDLDVLVTFREAPSLLKFIELEDYLTKALGVKVDLVVKDALKKRIGDRILAEVVPL